MEKLSHSVKLTSYHCIGKTIGKNDYYHFELIKINEPLGLRLLHANGAASLVGSGF